MRMTQEYLDLLHELMDRNTDHGYRPDHFSDMDLDRLVSVFLAGQREPLDWALDGCIDCWFRERFVMAEDAERSEPDDDGQHAGLSVEGFKTQRWILAGESERIGDAVVDALRQHYGPIIRGHAREHAATRQESRTAERRENLRAAKSAGDENVVSVDFDPTSLYSILRTARNIDGGGLK